MRSDLSTCNHQEHDNNDADGEGWTVPVGCGLGYIFRIAKKNDADLY